jgi:hypothetical protein
MSRYVKKYVPLQQVEKPFVRDNRTEIFEKKVTDKNLIQRNKLKTAMCKRMVETGSCQYGASCFFAHHQTEIRKPICFFGEDCKNKDTCGYDHATEVIPEMVPPPQEPIRKKYTIDLEPSDTFQVVSSVPEMQTLQSLMQQAENDVEFQRVMQDTLREFMAKTFNSQNTHYIPSNNNKNIKFIAVECDDEQFESLKEIVNEAFVEE